MLKILALSLPAVFLLLNNCGGGGGGNSDGGANPVSSPTPSPGGPMTAALGMYEAEAAGLSGGAAVVGNADGSTRTVGDLGGEASGRQAVILTNRGDAVEFKVLPAQSGANALVVRYSIPDAAGGGGQTGSVLVAVNASSGTLRFQSTLQLTSRYAWLYGGAADGTKLYNSPANAGTYATATTGTHLYDEVQLLLPQAVQSGDTLSLTKTASSQVPSITVDFVELEGVAQASMKPPGYLSITDPLCGAIALDVRGTGQVFDGADDSDYASAFNPVTGSNPYNPTGSACAQSAGTQEKDYYSNGPTDALQDNAASSASAGLSMFALADHNFQSLQMCVNLVTAAGSGYGGVWIPPGRFYIRGSLALPNNANILGAGMWYSKFAAVDTAPPASVTNPANNCSGIASTSGNFRFVSASGGSSEVQLSGFAMFGNQTQRDKIDLVSVVPIIGQFSNSKFSQLWVEHYSQGIVMNQNSANDLLDGLRVRNTFADGIDFYGNTTQSTIQNSESRSTGDDGYAVWAQGTTLLANGNNVTNSVARLQWFGNGFAVYGGYNESFSEIKAYDTLNFSGLKIATEFVPTLPNTDAMSSIQVTNLNVYRGGGSGFSKAQGAVSIDVQAENIAGVNLQNINIQDPTTAGILLSFVTSVQPAPTAGTISGVVLNNVQVYSTAGCAQTVSPLTGSMSLNNVCSCQKSTNDAIICPVTNPASSTFAILANTCAATACVPFP